MRKQIRLEISAIGVVVVALLVFLKEAWQRRGYKEISMFSAENLWSTFVEIAVLTVIVIPVYLLYDRFLKKGNH